MVFLEWWVISAPACQNLNSLYWGLNRVQSCKRSRWSPQHQCLKGCILENGCHCGTVWRTYIPNSGEGWGACDCLGPAPSHALSIISPQKQEIEVLEGFHQLDDLQACNHPFLPVSAASPGTALACLVETFRAEQPGLRPCSLGIISWVFLFLYSLNFWFWYNFKLAEELQDEFQKKSQAPLAIFITSCSILCITLNM